MRFRAINKEGNVAGLEAIINWNILPKSAGSEMDIGADKSGKPGSGTDLSYNDGTGSRPNILRPTLIHIWGDDKGDLGTKARETDSKKSGDTYLLPSASLKARRLKPVPIDEISLDALLKSEVAKKQKQLDDVPDSSLNGPFTEAKLIELTPKQLRKALQQSPKSSQFSKDTIAKMDPEDIRDIFRSLNAQGIPTPNKWCDDSKPADESKDCGPIASVKVWPKKIIGSESATQAVAEKGELGEITNVFGGRTKEKVDETPKVEPPKNEGRIETVESPSVKA
jgi:hypothetical protein